MLVDLEVTRTMRIAALKEEILFSTYFQDKFVCKIEQYDNTSPIINPITEEFFCNSAECFIRTIDGYLIDHSNERKTDFQIYESKKAKEKDFEQASFEV